MTQEARSWSTKKILFWLALGAVSCMVQGPTFVASLTPLRGLALDFFQEWASAKNLSEGLPIYTNQEITLQRYLGFTQPASQPFMIDVNAHPPTSVLLALPLVDLNYQEAFLAWNLFSLATLAVSVGILLNQLRLRPSPWVILPALTLLLWCNPFRQQVIQGQLNLILLALIMGTWAAQRSGRHGWAGLLLGAATAIKLFPGFLFLFFVSRRQWRAVEVGLASLLGLTLLTMAVLGPGTYRHYIQEVLPLSARWFPNWMNASFLGFFSRLFQGGRGNLQPLVLAPGLARFGALASSLVVVLILGRIVPRARSRSHADHAFGLTVTAMLLVSPIVWDHSLLLLFLPVALLGCSLPTARWDRRAWYLILVLLWLNPMVYWHVFFGATVENWKWLMPGPWQSLTAFSIQFYAQLGLFALGVRVVRKQQGEMAPELTEFPFRHQAEENWRMAS